MENCKETNPLLENLNHVTGFVKATNHGVGKNVSSAGVFSGETRVYRRRWWVMFLFCFVGCVESMIWNTWGPVAAAAEVGLGWKDGNVATVVNLANISYLIVAIPMCMLMDTKGLRFAMLLSASLLVFGSAIRCISLDPLAITTTSYICGLIQGISASVPFSGPSLLAAVWFPPQQRPVATAVGSFCNYLGVSMSFIAGPYLVPDPFYSCTNVSIDNTNTTPSNLSIKSSLETVLNSSECSVENISEIRAGITYLLYFHAGTMVVALVLLILYFPAKPPRPPSISASIQRTDYKEAMATILKNGPLWLVAIAGALPIGIVGTWIAILDVVLKPIGVLQKDAGWIGFWHTLTGCFSGIFIAKFSDLFNRRRKLFLMLLFVCAAGCAIWFALLTKGTIPYDLAQLYAAGILLGVFINGTTPLFYDISAEASYPVAEGVTGGFYTSINNVFGVVFLSLVSAPALGTAWMNWAVLAAILVALPLLAVFPETYKRTDIDLNRNTLIG
ncbi:solute carrier family 49 member 4 homolog [Mya arenaria]|uniref:solute carrier family 49 member 4 homolog n=1 Tax=Mya arenaria TaxID=6604 RepID=UPI0022E5366C|nr:solute carrier family 49 member 4 homolog [Mya arenaria]